ncbi:MAG: sigma-70 family RNA polymerase sigma factor [Alphaproteobacteria bacterium]|nr:sigma-70 family RNA polymerase sigma factor [Alphaproteobacteria bacterium]
MPRARTSLETSKNGTAAEAGDDAFRARLIELAPYLRAFARTLCGHRDVADDLAQESLASAWKARASFQPGTNMKAWLFMIQRNAFYSAHRRKWRQVSWDEQAMERVLVTDASQQASVELTDLKRAMTLLPDEQREALILVGAGGFSYQEAASICGCAVGTMKSRVSRGRHTIASLMSERTQLPQSSEDASSAYQGILSELDALSARKTTPVPE